MYENVLEILAGLAGLGGFISVLVNLLKSVGVVQDGTSEQWFGGINILAFIAVAVVYFLNVDVDWSNIDSWLQALASLIGLVIQLVGGKVAYNNLRGTPVVGYSHTLAKG